jgi:hypothetical protein
MCDCREKYEEKLTEKFKEKYPLATGHKVKLQGYAICLGESLYSRAFMPYKATAEHPLKKGGTKVKSEEGNMGSAE